MLQTQSRDNTGELLQGREDDKRKSIWPHATGEGKTPPPHPPKNENLETPITTGVPEKNCIYLDTTQHLKAHELPSLIL